MKRVLITGAAGFIGSHLAEMCVEKGWRVRGFTHYNSQNSWGWLDRSKQRQDIEVVTGDIRDFDSVQGAMDGVDTVFHLAALIGIPYSYISPLAYIQTNVVGTYNVLQNARQFGTRNILITSTSETYGTAQFVPITEGHPTVGQSPYSATKISADEIAMSYHRSFGLPVKVVRPFNTYGPRQSARAIIPTVITQILKGQNEIQLGNLAPTRDFTFVKDTCAAFIAIADSEDLLGETTNIGMNDEISILNLVEMIADLMKSQIHTARDTGRIRPDKSEVERLVCDNSKLLKHTDWKPRYDLRTGLIETIDWLKKHQSIYKPAIYNV